jgi:LysM repeat protein
MPNRNDLEVLADEVNSKRSLEGDYVIQKGDNLYKISKKLLGSTKYVKEIVNLNPNVDPRRLIVGSKIRLPKK